MFWRNHTEVYKTPQIDSNAGQWTVSTGSYTVQSEQSQSNQHNTKTLGFREFLLFCSKINLSKLWVEPFSNSRFDCFEQKRQNIFNEAMDVSENLSTIKSQPPLKERLVLAEVGMRIICNGFLL